MATSQSATPVAFQKPTRPSLTEIRETLQEFRRNTTLPNEAARQLSRRIRVIQLLCDFTMKDFKRYRYDQRLKHLWDEMQRTSIRLEECADELARAIGDSGKLPRSLLHSMGGVLGLTARNTRQ